MQHYFYFLLTPLAISPNLEWGHHPRKVLVLHNFYRLSSDKNRHTTPPEGDPEFTPQALANLHRRQSSNKHKFSNDPAGLPKACTIAHFHRSCNRVWRPFTRWLQKHAMPTVHDHPSTHYGAKLVQQYSPCSSSIVPFLLRLVTTQLICSLNPSADIFIPSPPHLLYTSVSCLDWGKAFHPSFPQSPILHCFRTGHWHP